MSTAKIALRDRFVTILSAEMCNRPDRPGLTWIELERETMWRAVNEERRKRGEPSIPISAVEDAENDAAGHVDYLPKWALYCAELVVGEREVPAR